jgi:hypothetical protein
LQTVNGRILGIVQIESSHAVGHVEEIAAVPGRIWCRRSGAELPRGHPFGNVPINLQIEEWAGGPLAHDFQDRLRAWETLNDTRVAAAVGALVVLVVAVDLSRPRSDTVN